MMKLANGFKPKKNKGDNQLVKTNQVNKLVNKRTYNFLVSSEQEEQRFWKDFFDGDMNRSISKFQRERVKEALELEERDGVYETHMRWGNEKQALEGIFQEPVTSCQMEHFGEMSHLTNSNVTFKQIFEKKKQNLHMTLPMILKTMEANPAIQMDENFLL